MASVLREVCRLASAIHHVPIAYHPKTNDVTERFNHTLADMIAMYVTDVQKKWDLYLPDVTYACNTSRQVTAGVSPYQLLYARVPFSTIDTFLPYINDFSLDAYAQAILYRADYVR